MVQLEDLSTVAGDWSEVFESSRLVPPPSHSSRLAAESRLESQGFRLSFSRLTGAHLPQEVSEGQQEVTYQLRVTLFDRRHQQFFGKTWKSLAQRMKNNKITFNEVVSFHS
ncbi:nephrocystin-4-like, partial [Sphaeramia orbicularis]|uniref:nephrocystin-4-like n=1 Tax=Sphaeramia orbicularis TaxID=375764 RepID=UPI001180A1EC